MEALSAALAAKPKHWQQHIARQKREKEARRIRQEHRRADLAAEPHKTCTGCKQPLPLTAFSPAGPGKFNSRCRPCHSAKQAALKRAKQAAWSDEERQAHRAADRAGWYARQGRAGETGKSLEEHLRDRQLRAEERRTRQAAAAAARVAERQQRREAERAEAKAARNAAKAAATAQVQAQRALAKAEAVARRQVELEAQGQDIAAVEIELALACVEAVDAQEEAERLTATASARASARQREQMPYARPSLAQRLAHLWPPERALNVSLRNGSRIATSELARRHWWREQDRRVKHFDIRWR